MKLIALTFAVLAIPTAALAQAPAQPAGPAAEALAAYNRVKPNILKAADKMPADAYSYKPTPDIRTFARVVNHVTEAQARTCSALAGTTYAPTMVPAETADKDTQVAALKASFDLCDKAYASLIDGQLLETVSVFNGKRSRIGLAWGNVSHDNEQYATLALYLRLKGLVPPSSEK
jgi:uncharacterized damage-inducible protein DinB